MTGVLELHKHLLASIPDVDSNRGIRDLVNRHAPTQIGGRLTCASCGGDAPCATWTSVRSHHLRMNGDEYDRQALDTWNHTRRRRDPIFGRPAPITGSDRVEIDQLAAELRRAAHPDQEVRCERTELPVDQCDHCRT